MLPNMQSRSNQSLQPTANPLRGLSAAELGRYTLDSYNSSKMPKPSFIPQKLKPWIEARTHFNLSHTQIQMARELRMNPKKLGGMANHKQEPWKMPLPRYIEHLYKKQFGKDVPDDVRPIETKVRQKRNRKDAKA